MAPESPPARRIFFDASLIGPAKVLEKADPRIVYPGHPDWVFSQDTSDEVWLAHVGRLDWLTVMRDKKIRYRAAEKRALIDHRVRVIVVSTMANLDIDGNVQLLQQHWQAIESAFAAPPAFYHLTMSGLDRKLVYTDLA